MDSQWLRFEKRECYVTVHTLADDFIKSTDRGNITKFQWRFYEILEQDKNYEDLHTELIPGAFKMIALQITDRKKGSVVWQLLSK